jgi:hypothetical protein
MSCYTAHVETRNITLTMPESLVRRARVVAAQRDTSVSALVADLLQQLVDDTADYDAIWAAEEAAMAAGIGMRMGDVTWTREDLHER